jgi:formylglycine-generating enzyme required for sulfatase activity
VRRATIGLVLASFACATATIERGDHDRILGDCAIVDGTLGRCGFPQRVRHRRTGIEFVLVEPNPFAMGSARRRVPEHTFALEAPYYIATTEVTVAQWRTFAGDSGYLSHAELTGANANWQRPVGRPAAADEPVRIVSFYDARAFCAFYDFSLPGEAQWEYACRAGSTTDFWWGEDPALGEGKGNFLTRVGRAGARFPFVDGHRDVAPVASFEPNPLGLYDMLGNVAELCLAGVRYSRDPTRRNYEAYPIFRGGSCRGDADDCNAAARVMCDYDAAFRYVGFRPMFTVGR